MEKFLLTSTMDKSVLHSYFNNNFCCGENGCSHTHCVVAVKNVSVELLNRLSRLPLSRAGGMKSDQFIHPQEFNVVVEAVKKLKELIDSQEPSHERKEVKRKWIYECLADPLVKMIQERSVQDLKDELLKTPDAQKRSYINLYINSFDERPDTTWEALKALINYRGEWDKRVPANEYEKDCIVFLKEIWQQFALT